MSLRCAVEQRHEVVSQNISELFRQDVARHYDGAILGASIHVGHHSRRFVQFVHDRRMWLDGMPVAFFSVSLSASGSEDEQAEAEGYVTALLTETGWQPQSTTTVGGGLSYRRYGFFKRLMMRKMAADSGRDTDTSRDHEYTDWQAVDQFVDGFLDQFAAMAGR